MLILIRRDSQFTSNQRRCGWRSVPNKLTAAVFEWNIESINWGMYLHWSNDSPSPRLIELESYQPVKSGDISNSAASVLKIGWLYNTLLHHVLSSWKAKLVTKLITCMNSDGRGVMRDLKEGGGGGWGWMRKRLVEEAYLHVR